jgi:signal transduction histidine kinase
MIPVLLAVTGLIEFGLAALVVKNQSHSRQNTYFAVFVFAAIFWGIGDSMMLFDKSSNLIRIGSILFLVAPLFTTLFVVYFTIVFQGPKKISERRNVLLAVVPALFTIIAVIDPKFFIVIMPMAHAQNSVSVVISPYVVYAAYFVLYLLYGSYLLTNRYLSETGYTKAQIGFSNAAITITSIISFISNLLLPLLHDGRFVWVGPLSTLVFTVLVSIAIIRHKLFDVRLVVARSLGYITSIIVIAAVYGLVVFGIAREVFGLHIGLTVQVFLSIATSIVGISFNRVKKIFDRYTNRFFYQDAYEPQELFDHLNRVLVSTVDLDRLLKHSANSIAESLKSQYCAIGLREDQAGNVRMAATDKVLFDMQALPALRQLTMNYHQSVIATDYLTDKYSQLKQILQANNIAMLVRLSSNVKRSEEGLGYIILGPKRSGNLYTNQDIRVLDTVSKELIIAIQNSLRFEEIENFNATLQAKVDEATRRVRRTNDKLKQLDETKDDFISMASHQLRTPLTSIKGYISMVLEEDAGKVTPMQQEMLGQAFFSSQRMVYLIADLLNVSRLKNGKFIIDPAPVNLADVVQQELQQLEETAGSRQLTLSYDRPETFPDLMLDETKTRQVIMNFVDNAIYYTPAGGHISVQLIDKPSTVELRVVDNGIGVPKSEQPHLFTKFYRAGNARKARPDGTGLGLFMAKKVIIGQHGSTLFESQEGKGSTFGFVFSKTLLAVSAQKRPSSSSTTTSKTPVNSH